MPIAPELRLIDLHTDWLLQYALGSTTYDPDRYRRVEGRLGQADGYLSATHAAILSCYRDADDWTSQADPWSALADLIARIEAEFPGRLLIGPADWERWRDDPDGLCWGVIGIEGFDALIRGPSDLSRLRGLFDRGVRLFQPVYSAGNLLGGSSAEGDDRGLTDLGRAFLQTLHELGSLGSGGPRPIFDLAHLNPTACGEALAWFEADASRAGRVLPAYSHGALRHEGCSTPRALTLENLLRLRALGGVVGLSVGAFFYDSTDAIRAGIDAVAATPFLGRPGYEGIAIGTDFLGVNAVAPGLANAPEVVAWLTSTYDPPTASALVCDNARALLARAVGVA